MSIGDWGLWATVIVAGAGVVLPRRPIRFDLIAASMATVLLVALGRLFVVEDWSWAYVADHARPDTNVLLRLSGLWAGAEGSLLLWLVMVAWAAVIASARAAPDVRATTRRLGAALTAGYGLVLVITASPFTRLAAPANGGLGLQPVLEHPAMVWHPPLLYGGLVGLLIPLLLGLGAGWSHSSRPWPMAGDSRSIPTVTVPLALLTAGLLTGAVWANVELGWGGFWAWDPIESAGLVAWLAGAALLHLVRRPPSVVGDRRLVAALGLLPGLAAVGATTLTRIGVVASVHAFADRPALRLGLVAVAGVVLVLVVGAVYRVGSTGAPGPVVTRTATGTGAGAGRRWAVAVLVVAVAFVAIGTYEPVVEAATTGDRLAIAGRYHTRLLWPVVMVGAALAVAADRRWGPAGVGAAVAVIVTPWAAGPFGYAVALAGGAVAGSALALIGRDRPGAVAHLGVGLVLIGTAGTMATSSTVVSAPVDRPLIVDGQTVVHRAIELSAAPGTTEAVATMELDGSVHRPRLVSFERRGASTAELSRQMRGLDEIQVLLLDGDDGSAQYRINRLPRLHLVWLGAVLVALGLVQPRRRLRSSRADRVDSSPTGASPVSGAPRTGADGSAAGGEVGSEEAVADEAGVGVAVGGEAGARGAVGGTVGGDDGPGVSAPTSDGARPDGAGERPD